ncbi:enduracididine biosynthesis enzyme MppP [Actinoalloteichus hymeniacidonis]|uniref:Class I and II aminotransferase n=1 Tax=Actinoalloteichus hymeniacidonis TaxID=340345 RepID=A0AAC9HRL4_9PSEU|nr:enduracididine biosynthesis enzyme MppP [Actinoalloteichus hymeniacidonis]AOS64059.1 class I and II aminotransferase [Actinoalloteichus hymeniacidonis]MBB5907879.1 enduracididine biosynthesis enzyme MppP [Actinoalloteichus hymeniacidonis]
MTTHATSSDRSLGNLTQFEYLALNNPLNLADGHARQELTPGQAGIIDELPALWADSVKRPVEEVEAAAHRAYFELLGQRDYRAADSQVLSCYSSSVAMEIFARSLATVTDSIMLVHPTFDNIPDILRGVGLRLVPLEEEPLHAGTIDREQLRSVGCVFVTTPNNPTGRVLSQQRLAELAALCAELDVLLTLDTSFRGFDPAAHYDHYAVLNASGCRWVVIEDTGKLWPTLELKIGWLVSSAHAGLPLARIYSDILLGVSPLVLSMVRRFSEDAAGGGLADLHRFIAGNRAQLRGALAGLPEVRIIDPDSKASVERIDLGKRSALDVWAALRDQNVFALPCQKFHWARPDEGDHSLRIALARPTATVAALTKALRSVLLDSR